MSAFEELVSEVKFIREEFSGLKSTVIEASNTIKEFGSRLLNIENRLLDIDKEAIKNLENRVELIEKDSDLAEQWHRRNNIEVKGIPQTANENLLDLLINIGSKVNYHMTKQQLNFVARTPSRDTNLYCTLHCT
ncbi:unnamed protein product [Pieris brassicae]|uniref:Uncharacterized protein n=1 Tax=Pieris brassicae TaxID=7116 RepID=A0A9P0TJ05_PIEBR|nr:unnamed protein product [Pieris brassicae]